MRGIRPTVQRAQAQKPGKVPGRVPPSGIHPPSLRTLVAAARDRLSNPSGRVAGETQGPGCGEGVGSSLTAAPPVLTSAPRWLVPWPVLPQREGGVSSVSPRWGAPLRGLLLRDSWGGDAPPGLLLGGLLQVPAVALSSSALSKPLNLSSCESALLCTDMTCPPKLGIVRVKCGGLCESTDARVNVAYYYTS